MTAAQRACEILKLLRDQPMSAPELALELGIKSDPTRVWLREMADNGLLVTAQGPCNKSGPYPQVFWLSPQWGGTHKAGA